MHQLLVGSAINETGRPLKCGSPVPLIAQTYSNASTLSIQVFLGSTLNENGRPLKCGSPVPLIAQTDSNASTLGIFQGNMHPLSVYAVVQQLTLIPIKL